VGKWTEFTDKEKKIATEMRKAGKKVKEISEKLLKPVNVIEGYFKRINLLKKSGPRKKDRFKSLTPAELQNMMRCYELGMTDQESAMECYMSRSTYTQWRLSEGLPPNESTYMKIKPRQHVTYSTNCLKATDIVHYNHIKHDPLETKVNNDITIIVDHELANELLDSLGVKPTKLKLADGPQGSHMGTVIGSKWDTDRLKMVTGKQRSYADSVKRLACSHG